MTFCSSCLVHLPSDSAYMRHLDSQEHRQKAGLPLEPTLNEVAVESAEAKRKELETEGNGGETMSARKRKKLRNKKRLEQSLSNLKAIEDPAHGGSAENPIDLEGAGDGPNEEANVPTTNEPEPAPKEDSSLPDFLLVDKDAGAGDVVKQEGGSREDFENSLDFVPIGAEVKEENGGETPAAKEVEQAPQDAAQTRHIVFGGQSGDEDSDVEELCADCSRGDVRLPPWIAPDEHVVARSLDAEIAAFTAYASHTAEEEQARDSVFDLVKTTVAKIWPHASVEAFGSYATNMSLPGSDIDVVVLKSWSTNGITTLANYLRHTGAVSSMKVIKHARIPLIKFVDSSYGVCVDISFDVANGPRAVPQVKEWAERMPLLRPMVLVVKQYLYSQDLADPFTGGLGSYALICMCVSYLQMQHPPGDTSMGKAVKGFFEFYGRKFNYFNVGISVHGKGRYFQRSQDYNYRKVTVCVEDPQDSSNEVGRSSFEMITVRTAFARAFDLLQNSRCPSCGVLSKLFPASKVREQTGVKPAFMPKNQLKRHQSQRERAMTFVADDGGSSDDDGTGLSETGAGEAVGASGDVVVIDTSSSSEEDGYEEKAPSRTQGKTKTPQKLKRKASDVSDKSKGKGKKRRKRR